MAKKTVNPTITFWSQPGKDRQDPALTQPQPKPAEMAFSADGRFYAGRMMVPAAGTLVLQLLSPRPLRLWLAGTLVLDEGLLWRFYERKLLAAVILPCAKGELPLLVEVGPRSGWGKHIDDDCPSRNREYVRSELRKRLPDRLTLTATVAAGVTGPAVGLRFLPAQYRKDGIAWQHILARPTPGFSNRAPSLDFWSPVEEPEEPLFLASSVLPGNAVDGTTPEERQRGLRHFFVPVANAQDDAKPVRQFGVAEKRIEPSIEVARWLTLTVEGAGGTIEVPLPAFESLGRQAPQREWRELAWPTYAEAKAKLPVPIVPEKYAWMQKLYDFTWEVLFQLVRRPRPESGLPNPYVATAMKGFLYHQFVWDSSFTAMCTAYGCRAMPYLATLDVLYSRQFDGGYIHREHDIRDGVPAAYEPDFSPNPPIMTIAEWAIAGLTGDKLRLAKVYPVLKDNHKWLQANRRLPSGVYWTTGLANGLDNSPSLGDGYPCLTAQMAHEAEVLGKMAQTLGLTQDAKAWKAEHAAIGKALNAQLWCEAQRIYATSLTGGGHNPNKVVTAFWPLWAGIVPPDRIEALARHLKDPSSFWRHHPIPSLAADSPYFRPPGDYWRGSTWAPTNFAAIKGFDRAGRHDLAVETALRHLRCMMDVLEDTGHIWENYCSEKSTRGSWSGPDYCWTALGPIAMLFEVIIGLQADALNNTLRWQLPAESGLGVRNLPFGPATVSAVYHVGGDGKRRIEVDSDRAFTLEVITAGQTTRHPCACGHTTVEL